VIEGENMCEVSTALSYNGEGLGAACAGKTFDLSKESVFLSEKDADVGAAAPQSALVPSELREKYAAAEQGHVFKYVDSGLVVGEEADHLISQASSLDLGRIKTIYTAAMEAEKNLSSGELEPLDKADSVAESSAETLGEWSKAGMEAVSRGEVAALVLSGGQGTRLGFAGPKGMYDIGLPSGHTLFQMFAQRIGTLSKLAGAAIPFYIMTSPMNHDTTVAYFAEHDYFGLSKEDVLFFPQGTLPPLTEDAGKIMLQSGGNIGEASDGNGGIYSSLKLSGNLSDMEKRGIKYVHTFSVDNAICKVCDPTFMGYCISQGSDCGNKVVWKAEPGEKVGVFGKKGGKYCVIEYSEMAEADTKLTSADGKLAYGAGNICNHFFSLDFLNRVTAQDDVLTYHVARKKIETPDEAGKAVKPDGNNGIKLECFIFDAFVVSEKMAVLEGTRASEFSPVKNPPGEAKDSPDSARTMLGAQAIEWIRAAGGTVIEGENMCEVSTALSYNGEGLGAACAGKTFDLSKESVFLSEKDDEPIELWYFDGPGRGELTRLALANNGVEYKDVRVAISEFGPIKADPESPPGRCFGSMPVLKVGEKLVAQSQATAQLASALGVAVVSTPATRAADMMLAGAHADVQTDMYAGLFGDDASKLAGMEAWPEKAAKHFGIIERLAPAEGFFNGLAKPTLADLAVFDLVTSPFPGLAGDHKIDLAPYPKIRALVERVCESAFLSEYLAKRGF
jgi:UDP-N-acetylglucosamine/UDP-N-acetylgalactosamine diphosphorylase